MAQAKEPLSEKANTVLGYLVTVADSRGEVALTREKLASDLAVSVPTVSRALKELLGANVLEVVAKGGGRGRPTRYRITVLTRDTVPVNRGSGDSCRPSSEASASESSGKQYQREPVLDPVPDPETLRSGGRELGEALVAEVVGFVEGLSRAWKNAPVWIKAALAGIPLAAGGALAGRKLQGGRAGALIGGGAGMLMGAALAVLIPTDSTPPDQQVPAPSQLAPPEGTYNMTDAIRAALGFKPRNQAG